MTMTRNRTAMPVLLVHITDGRADQADQAEELLRVQGNETSVNFPPASFAAMTDATCHNGSTRLVIRSVSQATTSILSTTRNCLQGKPVARY